MPDKKHFWSGLALLALGAMIAVQIAKALTFNFAAARKVF